MGGGTSGSTRRKGNGGRNRGSPANVRVATNDGFLLKLVPRRAVKGLRVRVNVDTAPNNVELGKRSVVKRSNKVNGTTNTSQVLESENRSKSSVVGNLETTANRRKSRERSVGELRVGDNSQRATDFAQQGSRDVLNGSVGERNGRVDTRNLGDGNGANILNSHVVGPSKSREAESDSVGSGREVQQVGDVFKVKGNIGQVSVVVDVEGVNSSEVDTV